MSTKRQEDDPEGFHPTIIVESQDDEHPTPHVVEHYETIMDNALERTVWYYCHTCKTDFKHESVTLA